MKIWITKYALTKGIFEINGERSETCVSMVSVTGINSSATYFWPDWHLTHESALERAEEMRIRKINSLQKQIGRLERKVFGKNEEGKK